MKYEVRWIEKTEYSAIVEADSYEGAMEEVREGNFYGEQADGMPEMDEDTIEAWIREG